MPNVEISVFQRRMTTKLIPEVTAAGDALAESTPELEGGPLRNLAPDDRTRLYDQAAMSINELHSHAYWAIALADQLQYMLDATKTVKHGVGKQPVSSGGLRLMPLKAGLKRLKKPVVFNFVSKGTYTVFAFRDLG